MRHDNATVMTAILTTFQPGRQPETSLRASSQNLGSITAQVTQLLLTHTVSQAWQHALRPVVVKNALYTCTLISSFIPVK